MIIGQLKIDSKSTLLDRMLSWANMFIYKRVELTTSKNCHILVPTVEAFVL